MANKAAAPDYHATADDVLGFLPMEAEIVAGLDVAMLRQSQLWHQYEPMILQALGPDLAKFRTTCGFDPVPTLERVTVAVKDRGHDKYTGVVVVRGVDTTRLLDCLTQQGAKGGTKVVNDRGIIVVSDASEPDMMVAATAVGPTTLVVQFDALTSHDTMDKVLASGAPLRKSPPFMALFNRRESTAQLWMMLNGNSRLMKQINPLGAYPRSIDGTLTVTDRMAFAGRIRMNDPNEAGTVQAEIDKVKGIATPFVDRFDARTNADTIHVDLVVTDQQVIKLANMMGNFGP